MSYLYVVLFAFCLFVSPFVMAQEVDKRPQMKEQAEPLPEKKKPPRERGFVCAGKTKCAQMTSCAEARFYLTQCGLRRLDRDNDGIPCETICR